QGGGGGVGGGGDGEGGGRPSVQRDERAGDGGERGGHLICGDGELHAFGMGAGAEPSRGVEGTRDEVSGGAAVVRGVDQLWRSVGGGGADEPDGGRSGDGVGPRGDGAGRGG